MWNFVFCPEVFVDVNEIRDAGSWDNNLVEFPSEHTLYLIEQTLACGYGLWQLWKFHVVSGAPEVRLLGKVNVTKVVDADGDEVVSQAAYFKKENVSFKNFVRVGIENKLRDYYLPSILPQKRHSSKDISA